MTLESDLAMTNTEQVPLCNLCGKKGEDDPRWVHFLGLTRRYGILRCSDCGLRWLSPRPSPEALNIIYSADHYFGGDGTTSYAQFAALRLEEFRLHIDQMAKLGARSVLDYGAATGEFVSIARSCGMSAEGVEFSETARNQAAQRGISLHAPGGHVGQFDVIHMSHVLEHLPDPVAHLNWCRENLNPGGYLWIEVPFQFDNDLEKIRRVIGRERSSFNAFSLHHTYFFSKQSLRKLCDKTGFYIESMQQPYISTPWRKVGLLRVLISILSRRNNGDALVLKVRKRN